MQGYRQYLLRGAATGAALVMGSWAGYAQSQTYMFDLPRQPLARSLNGYAQISGRQIIYTRDIVDALEAPALRGTFTPEAALDRILEGTHLVAELSPSGAVMIERPKPPAMYTVRVAQAAPRRAPAAVPMAPTIETVVVTAQHKSENIQSVPIAITALSQQQLTDRQVAAGPDLVKEVPNLTFSKTNFSGYNLEIRGIGTQAISVTTDPAVAVAFNGTPFIRNHFFEQEFFDVGDLEVLRGPQGTLYGRNATAGVVNIKSALPTDSYEAMLSADIGNYSNRRLEGMLNLPIVSDELDLRIAGEWTKRDGYSFNSITDQPIDGRDLWSGRVTLGWKPTSDMQVYLVWEHFSEDDDRLRSGKQLCETAPTPTEVGGVPVPTGSAGIVAYSAGNYLSQGCQATSLYEKSAFEVPNGLSLPYYAGLGAIGIPIQASDGNDFDPYASTTQSTNLRVIESTINPHYIAKNDTLELNADYRVTPVLTFTSQTGYNHDFLWSTEDYNRFNTAPGAFAYSPPGLTGAPIEGNQLGEILPDTAAGTSGIPANAGIFCDPQLGCSDRLVAEDLSDEHAWQLSQEFRMASNFSGPLNFSVGGNFLHYETEENYYVFINTLSLAAYAWPHGPEFPNPGGLGQNSPWVPGVSDNANCLVGGFMNSNPKSGNMLGNEGGSACQYIDPNPLGSLNNEGHNYFLSQNPYTLNSYAGFGEVYYDVSKDLKLTGGLRWTVDQKHFTDIPSELLVAGYGYPVTGVVNQQWGELTGRAAVNWTPQLDFTDQTLIYGSYAHGYKAGGANPPGAELLAKGTFDIANPIHPLTFKPEFIEAFELGAKNTLLNGSLTLNGDIFYYNYTGYQISEIVDRTAINNNYNAHVEGAEVEANWEPLPGLKFNFAGGWEDTAAAGGDSGIDLMERTAGNPDWMVVKPFITQASNCILPTYVVAAILETAGPESGPGQGGLSGACGKAYNDQLDPLTGLPYVQNPTTANYNITIPAGYPGFDPVTPTATNNGAGPAPNNGEGFSKNLSGHALPNAPPFTVSLGGAYSMPVSEDWVATARADFYWQADSWARIFNDNPYDRIHGYNTLNLALILNSANGWQVMGYVKNVFDVTAITGDFLNSDDTGLTTNVFLTDPRLYGVRVTKQLDQADGFWGSEYSGADFFTGLFSDTDNGKPPLWIDLGGQLSRLDDGQDTFAPSIMTARPSIFAPSQPFERGPLFSIDETAKLSFEPEGSDWVISASIRYGRSANKKDVHQQTYPKPDVVYFTPSGVPQVLQTRRPVAARFADTDVQNSERHLIMDFEAGKDVGLGMFGIEDGSSVISPGVRFASFSSNSSITLRSDPDFHRRYKYVNVPGFINHENIATASPYHLNTAGLRAKRSFHGIGPSISWNASLPVAGAADSGKIDFDWGLNGALLFGRQRARVHHQATAQYHPGTYGVAGRNVVSHYSSDLPTRSRAVTVPNLGGFVGLSMKYNNAKVSFGYRADEFFGAMDGGIDTYKSENRGFFGPFANISIGLGG